MAAPMTEKTEWDGIQSVSQPGQHLAASTKVVATQPLQTCMVLPFIRGQAVKEYHSFQTKLADTRDVLSLLDSLSAHTSGYVLCD